MITTSAIIIINSICITLMLLLTLLLVTATRMKGGAGIAALIIVFTTIPVYVYNMSRSTGMWETAGVFIYFACIVNTLLMPLIWLFIKKQIDMAFRFRPIHLIHFIPTIIMVIVALIAYLPMSEADMIEYMKAEAAGVESWNSSVNSVIVLLQVVIYFPIILLYVKRVRKNYEGNYSSSEYYKFKWVSELSIVFGTLFFIVMVTYMLYPRSDVWLIPIVNSIVMAYLTYTTIANPMAFYKEPATSSLTQETSASSLLTDEDMRAYCDKILSYLKTTEDFKKKDLTLRQLVDATGISENNISKSINTYLGKNFFELINGMRIESAKAALLDSKNANYTIDSIITECGFRSRSTFYLAFKKHEGKTPSQWIAGSTLS